MAKDLIKEVRSGFSFTSSTDLITVTPTTEYALMLFKNPESSEKEMIITHFNFGTDSITSRSIYRVYSRPTITSDGTPLSEYNMCIGSGAGSATGEGYKSPTISSNGELLSTSIVGDTSSKGQNRVIAVNPNEQILITVETSVASKKSFAQIYWLEI